jgi:hypothetical protein
MCITEILFHVDSNKMEDASDCHSYSDDETSPPINKTVVPNGGTMDSSKG